MDGEQTSPFILLDHSGIQSCSTALPESKGKAFKSMLTLLELSPQEVVAASCVSAGRAACEAVQVSAPVGSSA